MYLRAKIQKLPETAKRFRDFFKACCQKDSIITPPNPLIRIGHNYYSTSLVY